MHIRKTTAVRALSAVIAAVALAGCTEIDYSDISSAQSGETSAAQESSASLLRSRATTDAPRESRKSISG